MGARGVVTGGTWCADHNKVVTHWPGEDEVVQILGEEVRSGGSAANLALDLKRLDPALPVATIGLLGDDEDGRMLLREAEAAGLDTTRLHRLRGARTNAVDAFTSQTSGRRTHLFQAGVARELSPDHFDFTGLDARILHLGLPGIHEAMDSCRGEAANGWVAVLKKARAAGLETNLELCSIAPERLHALVRPCLPELDLLVINEFEIAALDGAPVEHHQRADATAVLGAARRVLDAGAMRLVVVHFPEGAVAVARDGSQWREPSFAVPEREIVGPNGAGDAFAAGFLYGLHEGWTVGDALVLAHACAAAALRSLGTTDAVEPWRRCLELARGWGRRPPI